MRKVLILGLIFACVFAFAEEKGYDVGEVVVTADRYGEAVENVGSSVSIVSSEDVEEKGNILVSDTLRSIPGLTVVRNGGLGGLTSVYIRGAESYQTLVMIDGVEMNDPISPARSFDFGSLLTDDIERIEVVRGPQSTLYGSDAIGGVINIITKRGEGKSKIGASFEGGSYYTYKGSLYSRGGGKKGDYSVSLSRVVSDGFSMAAGGKEKDGYNNTTFMGRLGANLFDKAKYFFTWRYMDAENILDAGAFDDDPNYTADTINFDGKTGIEHYVKDWWKYELNFSWLKTKNNYWDPFDDAHPLSDSKAWYNGLNLKGDWQNTIEIGDISTLVGGVEYQEEQGKSFSRMTSGFGEFISEFPKRAVNTLGLYVQDTIKFWERLFITLGGRYEDNQIFGSHTDYKVWASYRVPKLDTRLKCSIGTGFKAPSLFQLYSVYGSTDLIPEEVMSYDIGFEQPLFNERLTAGVTYFHNNFSDLIDWNDALWQYQNISKAMTQGVESEINWVVISGLKAGLTYTYLQTEDRSTGLQLDRRPMHTYGLIISWYPTERFTARLDLINVGERKDINYSVFPYEQITLSAYTKVDISLHYKIHPSCGLFGRIENLLDEKYEEVYGFNSPRLSGYGGMKVEF